MMPPEEVAETLAMMLDGSLGISLEQAKWACVPMDELPEFYVRNASGEVFRLSCEAVGEDEWQPDFDEAPE